MMGRMGLRDYMEQEGWFSVFLTLSLICGWLNNWIYSLRDPQTESEAQPSQQNFSQNKQKLFQTSMLLNVGLVLKKGIMKQRTYYVADPL